MRYYYENIESIHDTESILLIDEVDATLHPSYQNKLLELFEEYSELYKTKIIFTSHSLSLLEYALKKKHNVVYLVDQVTSVSKIEEPDIYTIKMHLNSVMKSSIYQCTAIPVFTEDDEAKLFLSALFDHFEKQKPEEFRGMRSFFHFVEAKISGDVLIKMFMDSKLIESTMRSICVVDGDKSSNASISNYTIALPGDRSPEELYFAYSKELYEKDDSFWRDPSFLGEGVSKSNFLISILPDIDDIEQTLSMKKENNETTKGERRSLNKKVYNKHKLFFDMIMNYWIIKHPKEVDRFYHSLHILFLRTAVFHGINPKEWKFKKEGNSENE